MIFKYHPFKAASIMFALISFMREREIIVKSNQSAEKINSQIRELGFEPSLTEYAELPLDLFDSLRTDASKDVKRVRFAPDSIFRVKNTPLLVWCSQSTKKANRFKERETACVQKAIVCLFCKLNEPEIAVRAIELVKEAIVATKVNNPLQIDRLVVLGQKLSEGSMVDALMQSTDEAALFGLMFPDIAGVAPEIGPKITIAMDKAAIIESFGSVDAFRKMLNTG
ncbi:MAG: hypothetical protein K0U41_03065, partial [Gammaproteobacteria bacterium]|nr:hypothetical protein [Gammaproteobacteria bacterium]